MDHLAKVFNLFVNFYKKNKIGVQHGGSRRDAERIDYSISRHPEFRYKTEFQSHEPEVKCH